MNNLEAYRASGYSADNKPVATVAASRLYNKPSIQQAIEEALTFHQATPEFAVGRLKTIAAQDKEIGAARLASKDLLELHGWNKNERPSLQLNVKNAFFGNSRTNANNSITDQPTQE